MSLDQWVWAFWGAVFLLFALEGARRTHRAIKEAIKDAGSLSEVVRRALRAISPSHWISDLRISRAVRREMRAEDPSLPRASIPRRIVTLFLIGLEGILAGVLGPYDQDPVQYPPVLTSLVMAQQERSIAEQLSTAEALTGALSGDLPASYQLSDVHDDDDSRYRDVLSRLKIYVSNARSQQSYVAAMADDLEKAVRAGDVYAIEVIEALDGDDDLSRGLQFICLTMDVLPSVLQPVEKLEKVTKPLAELMPEIERKRKRKRQLRRPAQRSNPN